MLAHLKYVANETVANHGDGALPQRLAEHLALGVKGRSQQSEADEGVDVEDDHAEDGHPHQRLACKTQREKNIKDFRS